MPMYKRYIVRQDTRILFFTSKPKSWGRAFWEDMYGNSYRIASVTPKEAPEFNELLSLPENQLIEIEMRIKIKEK